jgi:hypothetical protein
MNLNKKIEHTSCFYMILYELISGIKFIALNNKQFKLELVSFCTIASDLPIKFYLRRLFKQTENLFLLFFP